MKDVITVVSGLPRSGTSMMMRMLDAGGIPVMVDNIRTADIDNPKGYYEFERVKKIDQDAAWLPETQGKVVKMVSMLLMKLPPAYRYKIVFMRRHMDEILASQAKMLERLGKTGGNAPTAAQMANLFTRHLAEVESWLAKQANMEVRYIWYHEALKSPRETAEALSAFLGGLDVEKMVAVVDPNLHRNKA